MNKETLSEHARNLCYAIEELPASEKQTEVSLMASALSDRIDGVGMLAVRLQDICNDFIKRDADGFHCGLCQARLDDGGTHEPHCIVTEVIDLGSRFFVRKEAQ